MAETREDLPYPVLAVAGAEGDQGASSKTTELPGKAQAASHLGGNAVSIPSRGRFINGAEDFPSEEAMTEKGMSALPDSIRYDIEREARNIVNVFAPDGPPALFQSIKVALFQAEKRRIRDVTAARARDEHAKREDALAAESQSDASPIDKVDAPPSLPPTGEGLPEEIVKAIEALEAEAELYGEGCGYRYDIVKARSTLDATILHHLSAALAERDQALVDLSVAQGPDPEQAFDEIGMASRQTTLGKHKAANYAHIRKVIADLDAAGMTEAADTLLWAHWWRQNERAWTKYMRESCLSQQRAAESERDAARARAERAEKALEATTYLASLYRNCWLGKPVRDLAEAEAWVASTRAAISSVAEEA